jgi:diacylglycerol kinase (ATP)
MSFWRDEISSFGHAFRGIRVFFSERHPRIHALVMCCVIALSWYLSITTTEWVMILIACALVLGSEALNSSIEKLCDAVHPERNSIIRNVKDIAAGAVLMCVIIAVIIGCIVFIPYL